jgi:hypothetical protein
VSIAGQWTEIRTSLSAVPGVGGTLRPPATETDLERWTAAIGHPLPQQLLDLYAVHDGSSITGGNGFCFIGGRTPLPVTKAIDSFQLYDSLTRLWSLPTAVPFAVDYTGCLLAVRLDGSGGVLDCFLDNPPLEQAFDDIEDLLAQTVQGLRGEHDQYRCELTPEYLLWIDRDIEEEDLGYRV